MRMLLGLSETLPGLAEARFTSAKASSSLLFSPTELAIIRTSSGIPVAFRTTLACTDHRTNSDADTTALLPIAC
jgi:ATP adenylyltransferase